MNLRSEEVFKAAKMIHICFPMYALKMTQYKGQQNRAPIFCQSCVEGKASGAGHPCIRKAASATMLVSARQVKVLESCCPPPEPELPHYYSSP